jgi:hypothetical protein
LIALAEIIHQTPFQIINKEDQKKSKLTAEQQQLERIKREADQNDQILDFDQENRELEGI